MNEQQQKTHHAKIIYVLALLVVLVLISYFVTRSQTIQVGAPVSDGPRLELVPSTISTAVGNTFTVDIVLDTDNSDIYGVDINKLRFDPKILQIVDVNTEASGTQIAPGSLMSMTVANIVDDQGGLQFSQLTNPQSTYKGKGVVATITFRVLAEGTSAVTIDATPGNSTDSNIAGASGDILSSVGNGSYTGTR